MEDVVRKEVRCLNIELDVWVFSGFPASTTIVKSHEGLHEVIERWDVRESLLIAKPISPQRLGPRTPLLHEVVDKLITRHVVIALANKRRQRVHNRLHGHCLRPIALGLSPLLYELFVDVFGLELTEKLLDLRVILCLFVFRRVFCDLAYPAGWLHIDQRETLAFSFGPIRWQVMSAGEVPKGGKSWRVQKQHLVPRLIKHVIVHKQRGASLRRLDDHFDDASAPDVVLIADVYPLAHLHFARVQLSAL